MLTLRPLFKAEITLAPPQELGVTPRSRCRVVPISGGLVYVCNEGLRHGPADYMRTVPHFETGDARYAWLNRIVCVATGARRAMAVELEVFEVK
jgi:hypothetical protein